jgi:hypothetical protein
MLVDVYKSSSNPEKYLSVPAGTKVKKFRVADLDADYENVSVFEKSIEVDGVRPRAGFNSATILQDIAEHGFATHRAIVAVTAASDQAEKPKPKKK